jgi:5-bromo-4-chloroindolyl phosphate hydrolysis protein
MRKAEIIRQNLEYARQNVADLENELKKAEAFEKSVAEAVNNYAEKFNADRDAAALNPFQLQ